MPSTPYNPAIHHRHSIRLKGHDYAGGGMYFVTICAHRDFRATCVSPLLPYREVITEEWLRCGEVRDDVVPDTCVVMPDHFHGLIRIRRGASELGHVIGAFKAAVSRRIRRGDTHVAPISDTHGAPTTRIWHRNYYEMIVRDTEAEANIRRYIRLNPWRCVTEFCGGLRGMGNPTLWNAQKLGVLCSRNAPRPPDIPQAEVYFSGFHSPMEREILDRLLAGRRPVIWCPAWGVATTSVPPAAVTALEENRMLILEMTEHDGTLASAEARNRFVLEQADRFWLPYVSPGGMIDRLVREMRVQDKVFNHGIRG